MQRSAASEDTFRLVYDHVYPIIFRIAYRITDSVDIAEELCQEAFIKYYERVHLFPDRDQAKYWLIRVIKNLSLNVAKRASRERKAYERAYHEPQRPAETSERMVIRDEEALEVQVALRQLPDKLKSVLVLKEYGDLNYKEIASILSITEGNVKVRVFRARERLMELLNEDSVGDVTEVGVTFGDKDANATR
jgi:RNA polymerase sigma factor (sigma-70 family)